MNHLLGLWREQDTEEQERVKRMEEVELEKMNKVRELMVIHQFSTAHS